MIENNIREYPGDNATFAEFLNSVRCMFKKKAKFFRGIVCIIMRYCNDLEILLQIIKKERGNNLNIY